MNTRSRSAGQAGFSLVELMIAVTLGLIILAALTTFFVQTSDNRREMDRNTRQIENGRYAIDTIRDDVSLAGFYADTAPGVVPTWVTPAPCPATVTDVGFKIPAGGGIEMPVPIFGYSLGAGMLVGCFSNLAVNNDVLVVRRFGSEPFSVTQAAQTANSYYWYLQNSQCSEDDQNIPFKVMAGSGGWANVPIMHKLTCVSTALAEVWRMREQVYYLRTCSVCLPAPDGIPSLWRAELGPHPSGETVKHSVMVEGIEAIRFEYGIDNNGDGLPDLWSRCDVGACDATAWGNVTTVKLYVLSRNLEESPQHNDDKIYNMGIAGNLGPFNDKYKRHVYSANIVVQNRAGPREPRLSVAP